MGVQAIELFGLSQYLGENIVILPAFPLQSVKIQYGQCMDE